MSKTLQEKLKINSPTMRIVHNSGNNERYTPEYIIQLARKTMGKIDIDPASCKVANDFLVKADKYFDKETNGLLQEWNGKIWLNPPYERGLIESFVDKLLEEYRSKRTTEAIILTHNASETRWYGRLLEETTAMCIVSGRIRFYAINDVNEVFQPKGAPLQGQFITYLGENWETFCGIFKVLGTCLRPVRSQNETQSLLEL